MDKDEFIELCNFVNIDPAIALENKLIIKTLKEIKSKKLNSIKGQLLIATILRTQF